MDLIAEQSSMFYISTQDKYTHFQKNILSFKNIIYMQCAMYKSKYHLVLGYTNLGLENIGEIYIYGQ